MKSGGRDIKTKKESFVSAVEPPFRWGNQVKIGFFFLWEKRAIKQLFTAFLRESAVFFLCLCGCMPRRLCAK